MDDASPETVSDLPTIVGLDPRIARVVAALRGREIPTFASCEGHPDDFPQGTWFPWVHIGPEPLPGALDLASPLDFRAMRPLRERGEDARSAVIELLNAFYDDRGFPEDEVMLSCEPLGYYGFASLQPAGFMPGAPAHRLIGGHLAIAGRRDFHERSWREMDAFADAIQHI